MLVIGGTVVVKFATSVQPSGESSAGLCMTTAVTRAQAAGLAASLRESGWDVVTDCGRMEGAEDPCDAVLFQDLTFAVIFLTRGAWLLGDIESEDAAAFAAAVKVIMGLLETRFGWVLTQPLEE